jgi:hypothetical protein
LSSRQRWARSITSRSAWAASANQPLATSSYAALILGSCASVILKGFYSAPDCIKSARFLRPRRRNPAAGCALTSAALTPDPPLISCSEPIILFEHGSRTFRSIGSQPDSCEAAECRHRSCVRRVSGKPCNGKHKSGRRPQHGFAIGPVSR